MSLAWKKFYNLEVRLYIHLGSSVLFLVTWQAIPLVPSWWIEPSIPIVLIMLEQAFSLECAFFFCLISQPKRMLWVLKRTISMRWFFWELKTYVKKWHGYENIYNFTLKIFAYPLGFLVTVLNNFGCCNSIWWWWTVEILRRCQMLCHLIWVFIANAPFGEVSSWENLSSGFPTR